MCEKCAARATVYRSLYDKEDHGRCQHCGDVLGYVEASQLYGYCADCAHNRIVREGPITTRLRLAMWFLGRRDPVLDERHPGHGNA